MLGNQVELWETMLAVMKLGAVIMPTTTAVGPADLVDRIARGDAGFVVCNPADAAQVRRGPGRLRPAQRRTRDHGERRVGRPPRGVRPRRGHRRASRHGARRPAAPLLHLRDHLAAQAGRAHPGRPTRSATSRRCTGSACGPATCTSTSPRPAGPSTPGRASSRRGSPRRRCWSTTTPASTRPRCSTQLREREVTTLLRAADGVADAHQRRPLRRPRRAARGDRRRRAAQPRGHRAGPRGTGA